LRILVIDDEPDVLLLCRINLEHAGHEVDEAATGEEGLELALADPPDVIVLDVMLPRRDGLSVLEELAATERTCVIPVVLLTAKVRVGDRIRGWTAGASAYVTKPFAPSALADAVRRVSRMTPDQRATLRRETLAHLAGCG
jgi:DNA-binding response OmpR family regulator